MMKFDKTQKKKHNVRLVLSFVACANHENTQSTFFFAHTHTQALEIKNF